MPAKKNVRSKKPKNHAEGKPVRGVRPGVRGPNKKPDEILAEKMGVNRVIVIPQVVENTTPLNPRSLANLVPGANHNGTAPSQRNLKLNRQLQDLVREIGDEVIDPTTGWTRIVAVIRKLYADALMGKTNATNILLERGWGKVATPVHMDMRQEVIAIMDSTGLTRDEVEQDPILKEIMAHAIDAEFRESTVSGSQPGVVASGAERPSEQADAQSAA